MNSRIYRSTSRVSRAASSLLMWGSHFTVSFISDIGSMLAKMAGRDCRRKWTCILDWRSWLQRRNRRGYSRVWRRWSISGSRYFKDRWGGRLWEGEMWWWGYTLYSERNLWTLWLWYLNWSEGSLQYFAVCKSHHIIDQINQSTCVGSIHFTVVGFSIGSRSGKFTATASLSLLINTHSNFSSALALISWWGTYGGTLQIVSKIPFDLNQASQEGTY